MVRITVLTHHVPHKTSNLLNHCCVYSCDILDHSRRSWVTESRKSVLCVRHAFACQQRAECMRRFWRGWYNFPLPLMHYTVGVCVLSIWTIGFLSSWMLNVTGFIDIVNLGQSGIWFLLLCAFTFKKIIKPPWLQKPAKHGVPRLTGRHWSDLMISGNLEGNDGIELRDIDLQHQ